MRWALSPRTARLAAALLLAVAPIVAAQAARAPEKPPQGLGVGGVGAVLALESAGQRAFAASLVPLAAGPKPGALALLGPSPHRGRARAPDAPSQQPRRQRSLLGRWQLEGG